MDKLTTRVIYLRHTDVNGKSDIREHIVHNADKFIAYRQAEATDMNAEQKPGQPRLAKVEQITEQQYHSEKWKK